jgi:hypothetical protein
MLTCCSRKSLVIHKPAAASVSEYHINIFSKPQLLTLLLAAQETAINIGYACSLITDEMTQFQLTGSCADVDLLEAEGRVSGRHHAVLLACCQVDCRSSSNSEPWSRRTQHACCVQQQTNAIAHT